METIGNVSEGSTGKFVLKMNGEEAGEMRYQTDGSVMAVTHTEVDKKYEGQGLAKKLLAEMAKFARENHYKVRPDCPFVAKQFEKSSDFDDLKILKI